MTAKAMLKSIDFGQLLRAAEGLTQWRAMGLSFLTWLAGGMVMALGQMLAGALGSVLVGLVFALLAGVVFAAGMSAVGILLQDRAKGLEPRHYIDALAAGLACVPKLLGFALLVVAALLVLYIAAAIVYFVCKLPLFGPLLFFVVQPVLVVTAAVLFIALYWVAAPLLAPAIWDGRSLRSAVSLVVAVARTRIVQVVVMLLVLYFMLGAIALILFSGFAPGFSSMTGLAAGIIGSDMLTSLGGMEGAIGGVGAAAYSSGHAVAGALSTVIMFAVVMTLLAQVMVMGMNLIYLMVSEGLDEEASEASLHAGIAKARERARQVQELARQKAREAAERVRQQRAARSAGPPPLLPYDASAAPPPAAPAATEAAIDAAAGARPDCPICSQLVEPGDRFCSHCGHKLQ